MNINYFFICLLSFLLSSCFPSSAPTMEEEVVSLENTKWQLADNYDLNATIEFNDDFTKIRGTNGCNTYSADIVVKNYQLEFTNFVNTERYCEELNDKDRDFLVALSKVVDYTSTKKGLTLNTYRQLVKIGNHNASTIRFYSID